MRYALPVIGENMEIILSNIFNEHCSPRRRQEYEDSKLIREDKNAMANCQRMAIHHTWDPDKYKEHFPRYNQKAYKGYL